MFETILYLFAIISQLSFALQYLNMHICDILKKFNLDLRLKIKKIVKILKKK